VQAGITVWALAKGAFVIVTRETTRPDRRKATDGMILALLSFLFCILGVFAVPHQGRHRERAKAARSLNNLKQLAIAVHAYALDNDERLPGWVRTPDGHFTHNVWDEQINLHLKNKDVFSNGDRGIRSYSDLRRQRMLTYGLNGLLITPGKEFDGTAEWSRPAPRKMEDIAHPEDTILFAELATEKPMPGIYGKPQEPLFGTGRETPQSTGDWPPMAGSI
jgi:hypothetical protein